MFNQNTFQVVSFLHIVPLDVSPILANRVIVFER